MRKIRPIYVIAVLSVVILGMTVYGSFIKNIPDRNHKKEDGPAQETEAKESLSQGEADRDGMLADEGSYPKSGNSPAGEQAESLSEVTKIGAIPKGTWQAQIRFPDWNGYVDNTLAMNSMYSFEGWHGQGALYVSLAREVTSFRMYVNNTLVDTSEMVGGNAYEIPFDKVAMDGRNTIQISDIHPSQLEEAVKVYIPYPVVVDGAPEDSGFCQESFDLDSDLVEADIEQGFPSAQLSVIRGGRLVYEKAWGSVNAYLPDGTKNTESEPVTTDTLYDLASITKMFSVNYALQKLLTDGEISLDARVTDFLGQQFCDDTIEIYYDEGVDADIQTQREWKAELSIRDLLRHQGGFPADPRYFNPYLNTEKQEYDPNSTNKLFAGNDGTPQTREETIAAICKTPLLYEPGTKTVYSDVDYMILGIIVEKVTGKDLDSYLKETFYEPMGLTHITYNPLQCGFAKEDCAATELNGNTRDGYVDFPGIRRETIQGDVHDEKAFYCMGGVSGHAGLFSNATDLAKLASVMLTGGYGNNRFFSRNVMDSFVAPKGEHDANWGLGWWREGDGQRVWYFGTQAGSDTIGHQGWTGTLVMIDPDRDMVLVYLTNKINTRLTDKEENPNRFDGGWYTASTLGFVAQILSVGMDGGKDVSDQLLDLLADMADDSLKLIPKGAAKGHPARRNALSKISVLRAWAQAAGNDTYCSMAEMLQESID
ncbi:MAG: penicillin binding protein PBP4B [Lachnospiraceae bacterium]|nr:penicillin binding protein PBP4B [Lachnospiraceae bacterium]